jgi:LysR family glycine cleavage system transcriptional activator
MQDYGAPPEPATLTGMDAPPPFSALRALEAAVRQRSYTRAARELQVTHSAVSQAIRKLETEVGARLFERRGGAMEPSEAALKLASSYSAAARAMKETIEEISDLAARPQDAG